MVSGSDDVRHITDQNSARSHRGRNTLSRDLLRTIQRTKLQGNPPAVRPIYESLPPVFANEIKAWSWEWQDASAVPAQYDNYYRRGLRVKCVQLSPPDNTTKLRKRGQTTYIHRKETSAKIEATTSWSLYPSCFGFSCTWKYYLLN
ncbi:unnamed protein product [Protopolystoma xenopodis]|uniref:Uncharacterized protein n=1 Tax=Protopolystoma xenopodis TaxID=117903 RepID=A0A448WB39_9PLAT|nr:unnamed protein product [Protopolystoma xenopodis]